MPVCIQESRDAAFRARHGEAWDKVGVASSVLMAETRKDLKHMQGLYEDAKKSDGYLHARLNDPEYSSVANLLNASRQELNSLLAKPSNADAAVVDTK